MDYKLLLIGVCCTIGGLLFTIVNLRKGWLGYRDANAPADQRRTDLVGGLVFGFFGVLMLGIGVICLFMTPQPKPGRMATLSAQPANPAPARSPIAQPSRGTSTAAKDQGANFVVTNSRAPFSDSSRENKTLTQLAIEKKILNNLRQLDAATSQYFLDHQGDWVAWNQIVGPDKYVTKLMPADGEDYTSLPLTRDGKSWTVFTKAGLVITYNR